MDRGKRRFSKTMTSNVNLKTQRVDADFFENGRKKPKYPNTCGRGSVTKGFSEDFNWIFVLFPLKRSRNLAFVVAAWLLIEPFTANMIEFI